MRHIAEDLEIETVDDATAARLDRIFAEIEPNNHAARIIAMADLPEYRPYGNPHDSHRE